jgi:putative oxidoreductase
MATTPNHDPPPNRASLALLVLRLGAGLTLLMGHGWGKLMNFGERSATFSDPIGLGPAASLGMTVFAEVICALAVTIGLFTRLATIPLLILFTVLILIHHADDPFRQKELALMFAVPFLTILIAGPGRYSVDAWLARLRTRRTPAVEARRDVAAMP